MPADWASFIQVVSDKLTSQQLSNNAELANFLADQYCNATVGKAQSIFGNTHQKGVSSVLSLGLKKAFDQLEKNPNPTFSERENDPLFSDLPPEIPTAPSESSSDIQKEFLKWVSTNPDRVPDFKYFQFFEQGTSYPKTEKEAVPFIAKRLVFLYDGSKIFDKWLKLLEIGYAKETGKLVVKEFQRITKGLSEDSIKTQASQFKFSKKIFQVEYTRDQTEIPQYLNKEFIVKFTYTGKKELTLQSAVNILGQVVEDVTDISGLSKKLNQKIREYGSSDSGEYGRFITSLQNWGNSLQNEFDVQSGQSNEDSSDPYETMARAIISYWQSTLQKPLSQTPPVPPCNLTTPGMGMYIPISYGNKKILADLLRRAWNTGKTFKIPGTEQIAAKSVASALAVCFATHLLQLKFLYNGGISTPGGPAPMIGFVPFVF